MKRLELECRIENMSMVYEEATVTWCHAEFTSNKGLMANFKIWEDNIEPEMIAETRKELEKRGESFRVALKYLGNRQISFDKMDHLTYYFNNEQFTLRHDTEIESLRKHLRGETKSYIVGEGAIEIVCTGSGVISPVSLPQRMPFIPPELHGMAETLSLSAELNYPDLGLKLAYLILEELIGGDAYSDDELKIKYARDFVSHAICHNKDLIAFVESELPSAKASNRSNELVRFKRNESDHIAFVAKYAKLALEKARERFNDKVENLGGYVRV